jgi:hypothetical protein
MANKTIQEAKSGKIMSECAHEKKYFLEVCENCKESHEVYDIAAIDELDIYEVLESRGIEITIGEAQEIFKALTSKAYETQKSIHSGE